MSRVTLQAVVVALIFVAPLGAATAQEATPKVSPVVTFDSDGAGNRPPTARALTAAELKLARQRADAFYAAVAATTPWREPQSRSRLVTSWAVVGERRAVEQDFTVYWSTPKDVRVRADGALVPKLGGAHRLLYVTTNRVPTSDKLVDRETRGNFSRDSGAYGLTFNAFAMPRVFGELGGGTVYADMIVFTRDGGSALEPAPLAPLLAVEIQRLRKTVSDQESGFAASLRELEASMTAQAVVARRAKREERWKTETRDPAALAERLNAAHRTDEVDYARQKERLTAPAERDPKSAWWGPRLALAAAQSKLAELSGDGRNVAACGRVDSAFLSGADVRYDAVEGAPSNCVPMVRVRHTLYNQERPGSEVQFFTVWFRESGCGAPLQTGTTPPRGLCEEAIPLLHALDWDAVRRAMGW